MNQAEKDVDIAKDLSKGCIRSLFFFFAVIGFIIFWIYRYLYSFEREKMDDLSVWFVIPLLFFGGCYAVFEIRSALYKEQISNNSATALKDSQSAAESEAEQEGGGSRGDQ